LALRKQEKSFLNDIYIEKLNIVYQFNKANIVFHFGNYRRSLKLYQALKDKWKDRLSKDQLITINFNIASLYMFQKQYEKALNSFQILKNEFVNRKDQDEIENCDLNIATAYMFLKDHAKSFKLFNNLRHSENLIFQAKSNLGIFHILKFQENYELSKKYCKEAINIYENQLNAIPDDDLRYSYLGTIYDSYCELIDIYIIENDFYQALEYVERLKSRCLSETISFQELFADNVTNDETKQYKKIFLTIRHYSEIIAKEKDIIRKDQIKEKLNSYKEEHLDILTKIKNVNPGFDFYQQFTISSQEIKNFPLDSNQAILELFPMEDKIIIFIIRNDIPLDQSSIVVNSYNRFQLKDTVIPYLKSYIQKRNMSFSKESNESCYRTDKIESVLKEIYAEIFFTIQSKLDGIDKLIIIPYGLFHLIPFHALYYESDNQRNYLIDDFTISYSPSLKVLQSCLSRESNEYENVVIAHANPVKDTYNLQYCLSEVNEIKSVFNNSKLINNSTKSKIKDHIKHANIFHYAGHAHSKGLLVHKEDDPHSMEDLTMDEIFESFVLPKTTLVTLSACETGMVIPSGADEYIGIASGFISAGAKTVISSLWSVPDISTSLLMKKMYSLIKEGIGKAEALREAQLWLREYKPNRDDGQLNSCDGNPLENSPQERGFQVETIDCKKTIPTDYSNPYHWAGFFCSGAP